MIGVLLALTLGACNRTPPPPPDALANASAKTTFATVAELGPHTLEATVERTLTTTGTSSPVPPQVTHEAIVLKWRDQDHWSVDDTRDGRMRSSVLVSDGVAWAGSDGDPLQRRGDAEPFRVQLGQTWDPWMLALETVKDQIGLQAAETGTMAGRKAVRHTLTILPPPEHAHRQWTLTQIDGTVWIDEATAVRLVGDVTATAEAKNQTAAIRLAFAISGIGAEPDLAPPPHADAPVTVALPDVPTRPTHPPRRRHR